MTVLVSNLGTQNRDFTVLVWVPELSQPPTNNPQTPLPQPLDPPCPPHPQPPPLPPPTAIHTRRLASLRGRIERGAGPKLDGDGQSPNGSRYPARSRTTATKASPTTPQPAAPSQAASQHSNGFGWLLGERLWWHEGGERPTLATVADVTSDGTTVTVVRAVEGGHTATSTTCGRDCPAGATSLELGPDVAVTKHMLVSGQGICPGTFVTADSDGARVGLGISTCAVVPAFSTINFSATTSAKIPLAELFGRAPSLAPTAGRHGISHELDTRPLPPPCRPACAASSASSGRACHSTRHGGTASSTSSWCSRSGSGSSGGSPRLGGALLALLAFRAFRASLRRCTALDAHYSCARGQCSIRNGMCRNGRSVCML